MKLMFHHQESEVIMKIRCLINGDGLTEDKVYEVCTYYKELGAVVIEDDNGDAHQLSRSNYYFVF